MSDSVMGKEKTKLIEIQENTPPSSLSLAPSASNREAMTRYLAAIALAVLVGCTSASSHAAERVKLQRVAPVLQAQAVALRWCSDPCARISMSQTYDINAETEMPARSIVVSFGVIRYTRSDDELAFVIAHELAHVMLYAPIVDRRALELMADITGITLMIAAGYDPQAAVDLLRRMGEDFAWNEGGGYPTFGERVAMAQNAIISARD